MKSHLAAGPAVEAQGEASPVSATIGPRYYLKGLRRGVAEYLHNKVSADRSIDLQHGLHRITGNTLGIGGVFRAPRTIPIINSFARHIALAGAPVLWA